MTADYILAPNPSGLEMRTEINAIFSAILSQNSSATEPTSTVAGMFWYDTTTGIFKQRNSTNDGWVDKWDTSKGMLASLASPTFTGNVNMPSTSYIAGKLIASLASPTFTGTVTIPNLTVNTAVSLPAATSIGTVSQTEISYLDGVTSAIQTQLNAKQATLVSGTNIKTVGGVSLLGSGDIPIPSDSISTIFSSSQEFTVSGTFTVPEGVTKLMVEGCGGGGGASNLSGAGSSIPGKGGGGTVKSALTLMVVSPVQNITVTIGAGGASGGGNGGNSSFNGLVFSGGKGGTTSLGGKGIYGVDGGTQENGESNESYIGGTKVNSTYGGINGGGGAGAYGDGGNAGAVTGSSGAANSGAGGGAAGGAGGSGKVIVYW